MSKSKITDLTVEGLSNKGMGTVKINERTYFVDGAYPGDQVSVNFESTALPYAEVELISIDQLSPARVSPFCPHFESCRGCPLMGLDYREQLKFKREKLDHQLLKNKIDLSVVKPIVSSPKTRAYRNRGQFKIDGTNVGYADKFGKKIVPIKSCEILAEKCQTFLFDLINDLPNEKFLPGEGFTWNYIDFSAATTLADLKLNSRLPFAQGNDEINLLMKEWLRKKLGLMSPNQTIVEFFCGSGNFTEVLSESQDHSVLALEVQGVALDDLRKKELTNVKIIEADLFKSNIWKKIGHEINNANIWVLDPPRAGLNYQRAWIKTMPHLTDIIYISCDPVSFARDLAQFVKQGFLVNDICSFDQFPHTIHFEIIGHLTRRNAPGL